MDYSREFNAAKGIDDDDDEEDNTFAEYLYAFVKYFNVKHYMTAGSKFKSHNQINISDKWSYWTKNAFLALAGQKKMI